MLSLFSKNEYRDAPANDAHAFDCNDRVPFLTSQTALSRGVIVCVIVILASGVTSILPRERAAAQDGGTAPADTETSLSKPEADVRRAELENQLADLEREIADHQDTISQYQKKGKTLSNEIATLNAKISKLNLQIKAVNLNLTQLNQQINDTQRQINQTENRIERHRDVISRSLRTLYETDRTSLLAILVANNRLSDFFGSVQNATLVQSSLRTSLEEIVKLRGELLNQKQELSVQKEDTENFKALQEAQKRNVQTTQTQKSGLLKTTKGKESEYQKLLAQTKASAAQIRSRIFELLGGGELTFEKAYDYARLAEGATGVRAAMILGILHRESLLGKNTGRCAYNQVMSRGTTAMNPKDFPFFLDLLSKLNIDPNSTVAKISCPNQDGTYGGAMGPAQFIPSTWKLFMASITAVTGNNPPNPWNNADAFAATALYLKSYGAAAQTAVMEKKAAAIYYCG
ncbi:MAG: lytic murein transglycosylase, partial [Patescibacteria group bacterium]